MRKAIVLLFLIINGIGLSVVTVHDVEVNSDFVMPDVPHKVAKGQVFPPDIFEQLLPADQNNKKNGKIYAIIAGDTYAGGIGHSTEIDVKCMKKSVSVIGKLLNFSIHTTVLTGRECTARNIKREAENIHPSSKDIIIFYYSGHGHNAGNGLIWPQFDLDPPFSGGSIKKYLCRLKKRLAIVLFDCCNSLHEKQKEPCDSKGEAKPFFLQESDNLSGFSSLLLSFRGTVTLSASSVGEKAACDNQVGSYFTRAFLKSVHQLGSENTVSWEILCKLTIHKTNRIADKYQDRSQHPIFRIMQSR